MKSTLWPNMKQQRTFPWRKSHSRPRKTGWYHLILLLVCTSFLPSTSTCQQKNAAPQTAYVTLHSCWWWFSFEFELFGDDWRRMRTRGWILLYLMKAFVPLPPLCLHGCPSPPRHCSSEAAPIPQKPHRKHRHLWHALVSCTAQARQIAAEDGNRNNHQAVSSHHMTDAVLSTSLHCLRPENPRRSQHFPHFQSRPRKPELREREGSVNNGRAPKGQGGAWAQGELWRPCALSYCTSLEEARPQGTHWNLLQPIGIWQLHVTEP